MRSLSAPRRHDFEPPLRAPRRMAEPPMTATRPAYAAPAAAAAAPPRHAVEPPVTAPRRMADVQPQPQPRRTEAPAAAPFAAAPFTAAARPVPAAAVAPAPMARRDPAPSRWSYRLQRIMLTPHLRALLRFGLPSFVVLAAVGLYLSDDARRGAIVQVFTDIRQKFEHRPEFMVTLASVEGCSKDLAEAVRARLGLNLPQSSFDLDLAAIRSRIEELDAVKSAELRVRSGGILQVLVTEREPVAVWRTAEGLTLVDDTGHRVAGLYARSDRPDLPLIAGQGADRATAEALQIFAAAGPLLPRVRGLTRVGERRWDLVLDRDQRILLPAEHPVRALERLLALDHAQDILSRDLVALDLRLDSRPTLRLTPYALTELRRSKGLKTVETDL